MFRSVGWQELVIVLFIALFMAIPVWLFFRIFKKAGLPGGYAFLLLVPYGGPLIVTLVLAFSRWPAIDNPATATTPIGAPPAPPAIAPGWLPDPSDGSRLRYWNGSAWTDAVHQYGTDSPNQG